jgi:apolipoprotein D and lipocalin family protein
MNFKLIMFCSVLSFLWSCANEDNLVVVENFEVEKYIGKWYEIARFDSRFEKNLNQTTAEYSLDENGKIIVKNRGYNFKKNKWESVQGKAKFAKNKNLGDLKVSFFGPFYAPYKIIQLDSSYKYALVSSGKDYLWILSREKSIPENIKNQYLNYAKTLNYNTKNLIWVEHK